MDPAADAARRRVRSLAMALRRSGTAAVEGVVPLAWSITQPVGQTELEMGPWRIRLMLPAQKQHLEVVVNPAVPLDVVGEPHPHLPPYDSSAPAWDRGARLERLVAQECTTPGLLHEGSVTVRRAGEHDALTRGVDYEVDELWGSVGWLLGGALDGGGAVELDYRWTPLRLDSIVLTPDDTVELRQGRPHGACPHPLPLGPGERRLMNVWLPGRAAEAGLTPTSLFPVLDPPATLGHSDAATPPAIGSLPRTLEKLRSGAAVSIVAWGDEATAGDFLAAPEDRWQEQLLVALRLRFPDATINLRTAGPPDMNGSFGDGIPSDLVITEFAADSGLEADEVDEQYGGLADLFATAGSEWAILSPNYVRPGPTAPCSFWFLGMEEENRLPVQEDPRPYVAALRAFVGKRAADGGSGLALADAAWLWGRLYRQGLPYTSLLMNSIHHPDRRGMALFAEALLALLPASDG